MHMKMPLHDHLKVSILYQVRIADDAVNVATCIILQHGFEIKSILNIPGKGSVWIYNQVNAEFERINKPSQIA